MVFKNILRDERTFSLDCFAMLHTLGLRNGQISWKHAKVGCRDMS